MLLAAVPTYLTSAQTDLLTWVAEFKASEGGIDPGPLDAGQVLAIEFTIEAN